MTKIQRFSRGKPYEDPAICETFKSDRWQLRLCSRSKSRGYIAFLSTVVACTFPFPSPLLPLLLLLLPFGSIFLVPLFFVPLLYRLYGLLVLFVAMLTAIDVLLSLSTTSRRCVFSRQGRRRLSKARPFSRILVKMIRRVIHETAHSLSTNLKVHQNEDTTIRNYIRRFVEFHERDVSGILCRDTASVRY